MSSTYSLSEVFRMAEEIERNGVKFYTQAADLAKDKGTREVMLHLASLEKQHESIFSELREEYCGEADCDLIDPDGQAEMYINATAGAHVFNMHDDISELLCSIQSPGSMLKLALDFEKDTIVFFTALKSMVTEKNQAKIELLIQEEIGHIKYLQETLSQLD